MDDPHEPETHAHYLLCARFFALATVAHLTLPDAHEWSWLPANALLALGAALLAWRGTIWGWALAAIGLAWPLVFLGDQLTQSGYMLAVCVAGLISRRERVFLACLRALTVAAYAVAAFHKLNHDFLDPHLSCATGGMEILARTWSLSFIATPELMPVWPALFLCAELGLIVMFIWRPVIALAWALVMHIPLTIIFAPSFAYVMAPGWIAFVGPQARAALVREVRARRGWALAFGVCFGGLSTALYFRDHWIPYPLWQFKEIVLWFALGAVLVALPRTFAMGREWRAPPRLAWALGVLFFLHGMTPYLGLQFHHAGAMLSNLRADRACWNHVFVPPSVRIRDPYLVLEVAPEDLRDWLMTPRSLATYARESCVGEAIPIAGRYRGEAFSSSDLCTEFPLPVPNAALFQDALPRTCRQQCMH